MLHGNYLCRFPQQVLRAKHKSLSLSRAFQSYFIVILLFNERCRSNIANTWMLAQLSAQIQASLNWQRSKSGEREKISSYNQCLLTLLSYSLIRSPLEHFETQTERNHNDDRQSIFLVRCLFCKSATC